MDVLDANSKYIEQFSSTLYYFTYKCYLFFRPSSHSDVVGLNETEEEKAQSRLLWISNLWSKVKANDLTEMFAKFGQVI